MVVQVTDKTFDEMVKDHKGTVLVDFWASWCGPCKTFAPILEKFNTENHKVRTVGVNVENCTDVAAEHRVSSIPFLVLYHNGQIISTHVGGGMTQKDLESWVEESLQKPKKED